MGVCGFQYKKRNAAGCGLRSKARRKTWLDPPDRRIEDTPPTSSRTVKSRGVCKSTGTLPSSAPRPDTPSVWCRCVLIAQPGNGDMWNFSCRPCRCGCRVSHVDQLLVVTPVRNSGQAKLSRSDFQMIGRTEYSRPIQEILRLNKLATKRSGGNQMLMH